MRKAYSGETYCTEKKIDELIKFALHRIDARKFPPNLYADEKIIAVYESYGKAVTRMHDLAKFSPWVILYSLSYGQRLARATWEETGQFEWTKAVKKKEEDIKLRLIEVENGGKQPSLRVLRKRTSRALRAVLDRTDPKLRDGLDAIMPSLIVLAWTAFETMCEDLLNSAIALRPNWLKASKGRRKLRQSSPWEVSVQGNHHRTSDGSKAKSKLRLGTIKGIRDAFYISFFKDSKEIDRALRPRSIDSLFAVRNIVVHKAGIVDETFLSRVAGLPTFAPSKTGEPLQMDFGMVKNLVDPVLIQGIKLIIAVNKWVTEHPDDQSP